MPRTDFRNDLREGRVDYFASPSFKRTRLRRVA